MEVKPTVGHISETYNACVGCNTAIYPGEEVFDVPGFGYPKLTTPPIGRTEKLCRVCREVYDAVPEGNKHCKRCLNPHHAASSHTYTCPFRDGSDEKGAPRYF